MQMRFDTIETLMSKGLTDDQARQVRGLVKGSIDPETFDSVESWIRQCYHRPSDDELILHACNEAMEHHGTEGMRIEGTNDFVSFTNSGDSYAIEITHDGDTFRCECFADMVERVEREHGYDCLTRW